MVKVEESDVYLLIDHAEETMANHSEAVQFTNPFASTRRPPPPAYQDHQHHHQQQQQQQQHQQHQQQHQPQSYQGHRSLYQPSSHSSRSSPQFRQPAPITPLMAVAPSDSIRPITSASFSERTYLLPSSPMNRGGNSGRRTPVNQVCRPKVLRTNGQRPAALVNASVTYCGDGQIYAFGGFDQFTDEGILIFINLIVTN